MPKVGNQHFPYTPAGIAAARAAAKETGQQVKGGRSYETAAAQSKAKNH